MATSFSEVLGNAVAAVLRSSALDIPLRQRAKFEGWLKIELANSIESSNIGFKVHLESEFPSTDAWGNRHSRNYFADLMVSSPENDQCLVMLKTVNTNFRFRGVRQAHRSITKNFEAVVDDILKLSSAKVDAHTRRYSVFAVFPVSADSKVIANQLEKYLLRVKSVGSEIISHGFLSKTADWGVAWYVVKPIGFVG